MLVELVFTLIISSVFGDLNLQTKISFTGKEGEMSVIFVLQPHESRGGQFKVECSFSLNYDSSFIESTKNHTYGIEGEYQRTVHESLLDLTVLNQNDWTDIVYYRILNHSEILSNYHFKYRYGSGGDSVQFLVYSDGQGENYDRTLYAVKNIIEDKTKDIAFVLYPGDLAFPPPRNEWDVYQSQSQMVNAFVPVLSSPGNHDGKVDGFEHFYSRNTLSMGKLSGSNTNFYYSFNYKFIHVITLSSEAPHDYYEGTEQQNWLLNDLESVDRVKTPFIFVQYHQTAYSSNTAHTSNEFLRGELEHIFKKYKVILVFNGHVHAYERTCMVYQGKCDENGKDNLNYVFNSHGPMNFVVGSAGRPLHIDWEDKPEWSEVRISNYGFSSFTVSYGDSVEPKIVGKFLQLDENNINNTIVSDEFEITFSKCDGKYSYEMEVCSGRGKCDGEINACECNQPVLWGGDFCEVPKCDGVLETDPVVCSGHGSCNTENFQCECFEEYSLPNCSSWYCGGIERKNKSACSGLQGNCVGPNKCECENEYFFGENCELDVCKENLYSCSNHGKCSVDVILGVKCTCFTNSGYFGKNCSSWRCGDLDHNDVNVCTKNGICSAPQNCSCFPGYFGPQCKYSGVIKKETNQIIIVIILIVSISLPTLGILILIVVCVIKKNTKKFVKNVEDNETYDVVLNEDISEEMENNNT